MSYNINPGRRAVRWPCGGTSAATEPERGREGARDEGDGLEHYQGQRYPRPSWHSALHHQAQTLPRAFKGTGQLLGGRFRGFSTKAGMPGRDRAAGAGDCVREYLGQ